MMMVNVTVNVTNLLFSYCYNNNSCNGNDKGSESHVIFKRKQIEYSLFLQSCCINWLEIWKQTL